MSDLGSSTPTLGVIIVTFNSADVILDCIESLLSAQGVHLKIAIVDNASTDETVDVLRRWADGARPYIASPDLPFRVMPCLKPVPLDGSPASPLGSSVTLIETGMNGGFAAGVNRGIAELRKDPALERFWILNPDCAVPPWTPRAFSSFEPDGGSFGLMGGRVLYLDTPEIIQIDGGIIDWRSGVTGNIGLGAHHDDTAPPDPSQLEFITGASMVASREFIESTGPMREDYFLYYEEVDWALRRGSMPLAYCPEALVYHRAGTSIGSPTLGRPASPFSLYFKHRSRMRFVRRFRPSRLPGAAAYTFAKALQMLLKGWWTEAWTILSAGFGLPPSARIRRRLRASATTPVTRPRG